MNSYLLLNFYFKDKNFQKRNNNLFFKYLKFKKLRIFIIETNTFLITLNINSDNYKNYPHSLIASAFSFKDSNISNLLSFKS